MSKRDEGLNAIAGRLFEAMLSDAVMSVALQSHNEITRAQETCSLCLTHCGKVHVPPPPPPTRQGPNGSRPQTPVSSGGPTKPGSHNGAPGSKDAAGKADANVMLECSNCKRNVGSNRFAQHLSGCLGLNGGARRGTAVRVGPPGKSKLGSDGRSASPFVGSEAGASGDESVSPPKKKLGRPPKKGTSLAGNKRALSPDRTASPPSKKAKKPSQKPPSAVSNASAASGTGFVKTPSKLQHASPPPPVPHRPPPASYAQSRESESSPDSASSTSEPPSPKPVAPPPIPPLQKPPTQTLPGTTNPQQWSLPSTTSLVVNRDRPPPPPAIKPRTSFADDDSDLSSSES